MEALNKLNQNIGGIENEIKHLGKILAKTLPEFRYNSPEGKSFVKLLDYVTALKEDSTNIMESTREFRITREYEVNVF